MRNTFITIVACLSILNAGAVLAPVLAAEPQAQQRVEVVFCLDTTGSMGGLIEGAKLKIWSIANKIVTGKPTPAVSIGLVAYRDIGDQYVTKVSPLDEDLDAVFDNLQLLRADGGGDTPEHVNRALYDAVHRIRWSSDPKTLRLIFLVGDCPPHMDYSDSYDYRKVCGEAVEKDIIINTIQCGDYAETVPFWKDIAKRAEGNYASIAQDGGMQVIDTPFDARLTELSRKLEDTVVAYGSAGKRETSGMRKERIKAMAPAAAAERATYRSADSSMSAYDLIDAVKTGSVKLDEIKDSELPEEMRGMSRKEKEAYLARKEKERAALVKEIEHLSSQRGAYIAERLKTASARDSFDSIVQRFIKTQAERKGISY